MKKILFILLLSCFSVQSQNVNSVLAKGNWYKISVDSSGVYKLDKSFLEDLGINLTNIDPKKIAIYGNGGSLLPELISVFRYDDLQENAIFVEGENDGAFNDNDYILFYAKGPHDWETNTLAKTASHRQNIYSDKSYYFLTIKNSAGKRISSAPVIQQNANLDINTYNDFIFYEKEEINMFATGTQWFGDDLTLGEVSVSLPFQNWLPNSQISIRARAANSSSTSSNVTVNLNGNDIISIPFGAVSGGSLTKGFVSSRVATVLGADNLDFKISYNNNGNPSAKAYLDYIEVVGEKSLITNTNQFNFRSFNQATANGVVNFSIANSSSIFKLWDVTDITNVVEVSNESSGNDFTFKANGGILKEYVVLTSDDFYLPKIPSDSKVNNQNLHGIKDINYLIITTSEFISQAQRLANYHQENSDLTVQVVELKDIYNEFASGSPDITGIRDFIKYVYNSNTSVDGKLQFVCFFGDSSYDYKDRISGNTNFVPVKLAEQSFNLATSYVTDDFYAMLEDNEGTMSRTHTVDVATGRIPVKTLAEATQVVNKILQYYNKESLGDWRNTITLLSDDIDQNADIAIQSGLEQVADRIKAQKPVFNVNKIYADSFKQQTNSGGERYPQVKEAVTNAFEKGTLVLDYFGHGGEEGFASERILDKPQIQSLINFNSLPLLVTVTCEFSRFDNPNRISAGELMFLNANGGASSMISTTREVFISVGQQFNVELIGNLLQFQNADISIAQSLANTKNQYTNSNQKFFIYFFGDPAMHLAIPKPNVVLTKINEKAIANNPDTLKALSKIRIEGIVADNNNAILNDFNGTVSTIIFDKTIDKTTLDNDGFNTKITFDTQESKLFRGKASVVNGAFSFDFIVPKDVKIAYGKGKISMYAENGEGDKAGYNNDIVIGGVNANAPQDNTGPQMQLFMNDETFIEGGSTNTSPNLIVSLSDESGINTSVTSIDHDIVAIIDGDESNPIILNDFYQTELNDFTKGKVQYILRDLTPGTHTVKVKAWDTYNNSNEATLTFEVISDANLTLQNVLNYPNPFVNYTEFWFNHNKPREPLEVQVQIFTVVGKLIKTINQNVQTNGTLSRSITWNGLDDFGNRIGKGVYIYKLHVKSTISNLATEKYEKLVILQ